MGWVGGKGLPVKIKFLESSPYNTASLVIFLTSTRQICMILGQRDVAVKIFDLKRFSALSNFSHLISSTRSSDASFTLKVENNKKFDKCCCHFWQRYLRGWSVWVWWKLKYLRWIIAEWGVRLGESGMRQLVQTENICWTDVITRDDWLLTWFNMNQPHNTTPTHFLPLIENFNIVCESCLRSESSYFPVLDSAENTAKTRVWWSWLSSGSSFILQQVVRWWRVYLMHTLVFLLGSVPAFLLVAGAGGLGAGVLSLVAGTERLTRDIVQLFCHKITRKFSLTQLLLFLQILKIELQCVWFLSRMFRCRTKNYKTVVKLFFKSFTMFELLPILGWHRLSRTFHNLHSLLTSFPLFRYWECSGVDDHWSPVYYWCWVRRMECCRWADHWYHS